MTPAQQSALEGLLARPLTLAEIGDIDPLLDPNNRNDVAITAIINDGQPSVIGEMLVEDVFDVLFVSGDYQTLKAAQVANNAHAVTAFAMLEDAKRIGPGKVNLSLPIVSGTLDQLEIDGILSAAGRAALTARATVKSRICSVDEISRALNIAEGRMVL